MLVLGAFSIAAFIVSLFWGMLIDRKNKKYRIMHITALNFILLGLISSFIYSCSVCNEIAIAMLSVTSILCVISIFAFAHRLKEKKEN